MKKAKVKQRKKAFGKDFFLKNKKLHKFAKPVRPLFLLALFYEKATSI